VVTVNDEAVITGLALLGTDDAGPDQDLAGFRRLRLLREDPAEAVRIDALAAEADGMVPRDDQALTEPVVSSQGQWELPSWEDIVRAHSSWVYRLTGNAHDAEDLTQEVFVRVFRSLSSYTPGTFEGWLHRITTNLFLDSARRKQRIRFEGLPEEVEQKLPGNEQTPAQAFDDRHFEGDVQAALMSLPADYRAAVALYDIKGFSYEEIAATLGVKLGTVRSRIHRGRAQFLSALAQQQDPS
jgi:RNA polymerase sigma factor (sigma-70 family)